MTILKPDAKQLLAMKVMSARAEPSNDFYDAYILCKNLNIKSKKQLLEIVYEYIPKEIVKGQRQEMFIHYFGRDLGYDNW